MRPRARRRIALVVAVAVLAATPLLGLAGPPAAALDVPVPGTPAFPSWIDPLPHWEPENTCDPVDKPGATDLARILHATYGADIPIGISRACTPADSGHDEGRALDWMVTARSAQTTAMGDAFVGWLLAADAYGNQAAMARRLGVMYLIWNSRRFYLFDPAAGWREYSTCLTARTSPADDTYCHRNHVHVSLTWAGARRQTSWWTLAGGPLACSASGDPVYPTPPLPVAGTSTPIAPTRVLDTAGGVGTPLVPFPCTIQAGRRIDVVPLGRGGVPAAGVASVVVRAQVRGGSADTWVVPAMLGGPPPQVGRLAVPAGQAVSATWTVPLGSPGVLSLHTGPVAPAAIALDVLGYLPQRAAPPAPEELGAAAAALREAG